jgi:hypothetical protein
MLEKSTTHSSWIAEEMAERIKFYWAAKGYRVRAWVEPVPGKFGVFQVRSDLVNGAPRA